MDISFAPRRETVAPGLGGILGLTYPFVLVIYVFSVGFRSGGDMGDFAASLAAAVLYLIAAPTAWIFSLPFIDVTRVTVFVTGIVTSAPIWYLVGRLIALRSYEWGAWLRRYVIACTIWTAFDLVTFGVVAAIFG